MECWRKSKHKNTGGGFYRYFFSIKKKKGASNTLLHPEYLPRLCLRLGESQSVSIWWLPGGPHKHGHANWLKPAWSCILTSSPDMAGLSRRGLKKMLFGRRNAVFRVLKNLTRSLPAVCWTLDHYSLCFVNHVRNVSIQKIVEVIEFTIFSSL